MTTATSTEVGLVRVRHSHLDENRMRARLWASLRTAKLTPAGLAPSAVLVVRHLEATLPRGIVDPSASPATAWHEDLRSQLTRAFRRAVRPRRHCVPSGADAVVFEDWAHFLACVLGQHSVGARPWWSHQLLEQQSVSAGALLERHLEILPGVLHLMESWDLVVPMLRKLTAQEALQLVDGLVHTFDLATPPSSLSTTGQGAAVRPQLLGGDELSATPDDLADLSSAWDGSPGNLTARRDLGPEAALLLAAALLLHRAPGRARSPSVARLLRSAGSIRESLGGHAADPRGNQVRGSSGRLRYAEKLDGSPSVYLGRPEDARPRVHDVLDRRLNPLSPGPASHPVPSPVGERRPAGSIPVSPGDPEPTDAEAERPGGPAHVSKRSSEETPGRMVADAARQPSDADPDGDTSPAAEPTPASVTAVPMSRSSPASTELAGVFYVVNVITALELPATVHPGWRLSELSGWALLECLARGLLDDRAEQDAGIVHDPLWGLLAVLDGRDVSDPPGLELDEPPEHALPSAWRDRVEPTSPGALTAAVLAGTRRWLGLGVPWVRAWLADALDTPTGRVADLLLVAGDVHHSQTHIDVVMDLEAISVPVRLAGLDRNPGWVPRFGRVVCFHFLRGGPG